MKSERRISILLAKIEKLWRLNPDQNFGQMLTNFIFKNMKNAWLYEDDYIMNQIDYSIEFIKYKRRNKK